MEVTTVEDVRRTCGITKDLIDDDDVQKTISRAVKETGKLLNTSILPREVIDVITPDERSGSETIILRKNPVLRVKDIKIDGTSVSVQYIRLHEGSGLLSLTSDAEESYFVISGTKRNAVRYVYGLIETSDDVETTVSTAVTTPTNDYTLVVSDGSIFNVNDWVRIEGMDGYYEVTKVEGVSGNNLTVDLTYPHEATSRVILMVVPEDVKRLVEIVSGLMLVAREVGASFKDIVGYTLGDRSIQKGEPYTQWRETHVQLRKEYVELMKARRRRPSIG